MIETDPKKLKIIIDQAISFYMIAISHMNGSINLSRR